MTTSQVIISGQFFKLIPWGFCACGCGQKTSLSEKTRTSRGYVEGQPVKYLYGHARGPSGRGHWNWKGGRRKHSGGYVEILCPQHPRAKCGYILEHILVVEKALGKYLPNGAVPHHVNGKKNDNRNSNLVLCQDLAYHNLIEQRTRAYKACGNAHWLRCPFCKQWDDPKNLYVYKGKNVGHHRNCATAYKHKR